MLTIARHSLETPLAPAEIRARLAYLVARRDLWHPLVRQLPTERTFELLHRDDDLEAWVISWGQGHDTGMHDHGDSAGAFAVVAGEVEETELHAGPGWMRRSTQHFTAGDVRAFSSDHVHRVQAPDPVGATTIHVYSPPLGVLGRYDVDDRGTLRRTARPVEEPLVHGASA